jgi:hypothetical protein
MITVFSVGLFILGIVLFLLSANTLSLYRSKIPRHQQGSAGTKTVWLMVGGAILVSVGVALFIVRSVAP